MPTTTPISPREQMLITILRTIVEETMDFPAVRPFASESYLPPHMIENAQSALTCYGCKVVDNTPWTAVQSEPTPAPAPAPACVSCAYINKKDWEQPYCNHPQAVCPVSGTRHRLCHDERESCSPHAYCGAAGRGFVDRQEDDEQAKAPPSCVDCRHAKRVAQSPTEDATELFCDNPKMGWRAGVGTGVKCLTERSFHSTLAGCGATGRLFEAANTSEVAA